MVPLPARVLQDVVRDVQHHLGQVEPVLRRQDVLVAVGVLAAQEH
jgi:hypothetical protein